MVLILNGMNKPENIAASDAAAFLNKDDECCYYLEERNKIRLRTLILLYN